jgi:hypothetical protein
MASRPRIYFMTTEFQRQLMTKWMPVIEQGQAYRYVVGRWRASPALQNMRPSQNSRSSRGSIWVRRLSFN